jgi:four helix bundle protein
MRCGRRKHSAFSTQHSATDPFLKLNAVAAAYRMARRFEGDAMKNFRDLLVWQKSHQLTLNTYRETKSFPNDERFGLTSQIRRSAASIPANIAEGCGRRGNAEFHRFLQVAMGSASELEYHLLLANDLNYLKAESYNTLNDQVCEIKRMLAALLLRVDKDRYQTKAAGM